MNSTRINWFADRSLPQQVKDEQYPKVTIITPSYNQGEYLEDTLLSIIHQEYPNLELLVFDGGSTDDSKSILERYDSYIAHWESTKDRGQSHAINKGLERATGILVNWLNSDDLLAEGALQRIVATFKMTNARCISGQSGIFEGQILKRWKGPSYIDPESLNRSMAACYIEQPSTFFHRDTLNTLGPVPEQLHFTMDKIWWLRFLVAFGPGAVEQMEEPIAYFRHHSTSKTVDQGALFYEEHAAWLLSFATSFKLENVSKLLLMRFPNIVQVEEHVDGVNMQQVHEMCLTFLLKLASRVYHKPDFEFAQAVLSYSKTVRHLLAQEELGAMKRLEEKIGFSSWTAFRIKRKLNFLLKR